MARHNRPIQSRNLASASVNSKISDKYKSCACMAQLQQTALKSLAIIITVMSISLSMDMKIKLKAKRDGVKNNNRYFTSPYKIGLNQDKNVYGKYKVVCTNIHPQHNSMQVCKFECMASYILFTFYMIKASEMLSKDSNIN